MATRSAWVAWVSIWVIAGCHGAAQEQPQTAADLPAPVSAENDRDGDCGKACRQVGECRPNVAYEACVSRCGQSHWVESNSTHCLALRVLWINEEGCSRIGPTWDGFDDADDCDDQAIQGDQVLQIADDPDER